MSVVIDYPRAWCGDVIDGRFVPRRDPFFYVWPRVTGGGAVHWHAVFFYRSITFCFGRRSWWASRTEPNRWRSILSVNIDWLAFGGGWRFPRIKFSRGEQPQQDKE